MMHFLSINPIRGGEWGCSLVKATAPNVYSTRVYIAAFSPLPQRNDRAKNFLKSVIHDRMRSNDEGQLTSTRVRVEREIRCSVLKKL